MATNKPTPPSALPVQVVDNAPGEVFVADLTEEEQAFAEARHSARKAGQDLPAIPPRLALWKRRVPRFSYELLEKVRVTMASGAPAERAFEAVGVPPRVFRQWVRWGQEGMREEYVRLVETIEQADAQFEVARLARVATGKAGWASSAWLLERKYSDRYALKTRQEISGPGGGPVLIAPGRALLPAEEEDDG